MKRDKAPTGADEVTAPTGPDGLRPEIRRIIEALAREAVAHERAQAQDAPVECPFRWASTRPASRRAPRAPTPHSKGRLGNARKAGAENSAPEKRDDVKG